ncbi:MAG: hypothetical protein LUF25_00145 [Phascolarctobacterium sp.]|nr:hypothetical protein [Phascolarctobacterium sp.]
MGYKVSSSYKYWDDSVEQFCPHKIIVRDYVNKFKTVLEAAGHIFKGENNDEDLSEYSDDTIYYIG